MAQAALGSLDLEAYRPALTGHCYRMLGCASEADDAVQDTMVRAWRGLDDLSEPAALRSWLFRIATRVCLDALGQRQRRGRTMDLAPLGSLEDPLEALPAASFIEPVADAAVLDAGQDPAERLRLRQSVRLAYVAALQELAPRQRAALLLTQLLGWSAAEVAQLLETSVPAINSALQRARAKLASGGHGEDTAQTPSDVEAKLAERFVDAFERYDIDALTQLLHEDATLSMPPYSLWLRGHADIRGWLLGRGVECRGSRLLPCSACGSPAFGQYRRDPQTGDHTPWSLLVLELRGQHIAGLVHFLDTQTLFPRFELPPRLPATA